MRSRKELVSILKELKAEMASLFGVTQLGLFNSLFVGDTGIYAIAAFSGDRDLLDMASLSRFIEEKTGERITIISLQGLKGVLKPCILQADEMTPEGVLLFHNEIIRSISDIELFCRGMRYEQFLEDSKTRHAVISLLSSIGMISRCLPDDHKNKYPTVPWTSLAALPEMISPCYGTDLRLVWNLVERRLLSIRRSLEVFPGIKVSGDQQRRKFF